MAVFVVEAWKPFGPSGINTVNYVLAKGSAKELRQPVHCLVSEFDDSHALDARNYGVVLLPPSVPPALENTELDFRANKMTAATILGAHKLYCDKLSTLQGIRIVVGHYPLTSKAAYEFLKECFPQADFILFVHSTPTIGESQPTPEQSAELLQLASFAKSVFSVGDKVFEECSSILQSAEKRIPHYLYLPRPDDKMFDEIIDTKRKASTAKRILTYDSFSTPDEHRRHYGALSAAVEKICTNGGKTSSDTSLSENMVWNIHSACSEKERDQLEAVMKTQVQSLRPNLKAPISTAEEYRKTISASEASYLPGYEPHGLLALGPMSAGLPFVVLRDSYSGDFIVRHFPEFKDFFTVNTSGVQSGTPTGKDIEKLKERLGHMLKQPTAAYKRARKLREKFKSDEAFNGQNRQFIRDISDRGGAVDARRFSKKASKPQSQNGPSGATTEKSNPLPPPPPPKKAPPPARIEESDAKEAKANETQVRGEREEQQESEKNQDTPLQNPRTGNVQESPDEIKEYVLKEIDVIPANDQKRILDASIPDLLGASKNGGSNLKGLMGLMIDRGLVNSENNREYLSVFSNYASEFQEKCGYPLSIPPASKCYVNSENLTETIHRKYTDRQISSRPVVTVLYGIGGCGKTEAAAQYVTSQQQEYVGGVFWINAEYKCTIKHCFQQIANSCCEERLSAEDEFQTLVEQVLSRKDWLLVLDNVDKIDIILQSFLKLQSGGHIIVTTRDAQLSPQLETHFKASVFDVRVELLGKKDSEKLLVETALVDQKKTKLKKKDRDALEWLAGSEGLCGMPLAILAASNYMKQNMTNFSNYKAIYEEGLGHLYELEKKQNKTRQDPLYLFLKANGLKEYHIKLSKYVDKSLPRFLEVTKARLLEKDIGMSKRDADTFIRARNSYDKLDLWRRERQSIVTTLFLNFQKNTAALEFLRLCSYLGTEIPENLFMTEAVNLTESPNLWAVHSKETVVNDEGSPTNTAKILENLNTVEKRLIQYGLLSKEENNIKIHRLVQMIVDLDLEIGRKKEKTQAINTAIKVLRSRTPLQETIKKVFSIGTASFGEDQTTAFLQIKELERRLTDTFIKENKKELLNPGDLFEALALYLSRDKSTRKDAIYMYRKTFSVTELFAPDGVTAKHTRARKKLLGNACSRLGVYLVEIGETKLGIDQLNVAKNHFLDALPEREQESDLQLAFVYKGIADAHRFEIDSREPRGKDRNEKLKENKEFISSLYSKALSIIRNNSRAFKHENISSVIKMKTAILLHDLGSFSDEVETLTTKDGEDIADILLTSLEKKKEVLGENTNSLTLINGMRDLSLCYLRRNEQKKNKVVLQLLKKSLSMTETVFSSQRLHLLWQYCTYYLIKFYHLAGNTKERDRLRRRLRDTGCYAKFEHLMDVKDPIEAFPYPPYTCRWLYETDELLNLRE